MNKNAYLIIAMILSIILIILIINSYYETEHLENTNNDDALNKFISSDKNKSKIKLKWICPDNNMTYYLGVIPKSKIDKKCGAFDYVNKNEFTVRPDGTNPGVTIKPEYFLVLVNQYYIQSSNCKDTNSCVVSKFDESYFNFYLKDIGYEPNYAIQNKLYQLEFVPENTEESHLVTFAKNDDIVDNKGNFLKFGEYTKNLSIIKKAPESVVALNSKITKSFNEFNIEKVHDIDGNFNGFKIYFDKVPIYGNDNKDIAATSRKYVGILLSESPCNNTDCTLETCTKTDKKCIKCCSIDHKYLILYDKIFNKKDNTNIVTFIPESSELFKLRYVNATTDCAYDRTEVGSESCEPVYG